MNKFIDFLYSLKKDSNSNLIESIEKGYSILFESISPVVYHRGTITPNQKLAIGSRGMHFGTEKASNERMSGKFTEELVDSIQVYQKDDGWHWKTSDGGENIEVVNTKEEAYENAKEYCKEYINDEAVIDYLKDEYFLIKARLNFQNPKKIDDQGKDWEREIAKAKQEGYDGIIYKNLWEDPGTISYIAFYDKQVMQIK